MVGLAMQRRGYNQWPGLQTGRLGGVMRNWLLVLTALLGGLVSGGFSSALAADVDGDGFYGTTEYCGSDDQNYYYWCDCNDDDPAINPEATEDCDGVDNDCDGQVDEAGDDGDLDGFTDDPCNDTDDCDDTNPSMNPGAVEFCDNADNDCDGTIDEGVTVKYYVDADGDGAGDANTDPVEACDGYGPAGYSIGGDCNDSNSDIRPGTVETVCDDGIDNNCDGTIDEDTEYCLDEDEGGLGEVIPGGCSTSPGAPPTRGWGILGLVVGILVGFRRSSTR
ncbi:MAG: putative metal-binding motif-containing protein [Candidatus Kerfeldbacteria bacterium]|nr:putative metal-binding motif-containing protein [Candidatus Kerfeldbacteria bacterium]